MPRRDAVVTRRLRAAGAAIVGKTNMHELAYGATTANPHFGTCANAWDASRVCGGSSGGSGVALGADLCLAALGTDTGGSVRIPAALNGVTALRPTYGSVSNRGVLPITPSLDTVGAMARSALDTAAVARAIAGYDRHDPYAVAPPGLERRPAPVGRPLHGLRVAVADGYFFDDVSVSVTANAHAAAGVLRELGAKLERIDTAAARRATADCSLLIRAEALALHERRLARDAESLGEDVRRRLELGRDVTGVQVARALDRMRHWQARMRVALDRVDMILTPHDAGGGAAAGRRRDDLDHCPPDLARLSVEPRRPTRDLTAERQWRTRAADGRAADRRAVARRPAARGGDRLPGSHQLPSRAPA